MIFHQVSSRAFFSLSATVLAAVALAACASPAPAPSPTVPSPTRSSSAPSPIGFVPGGTAEQNLPIFSQVINDVWATENKNTGQAYVDALASVGFDKTQMQITPDKTPYNHDVDNIQIAVLIGNECLIGQVGKTTPQPVTNVFPELAEGGCLIGDTAPIK